MEIGFYGQLWALNIWSSPVAHEVRNTNVKLAITQPGLLHWKVYKTNNIPQLTYQLAAYVKSAPIAARPADHFRTQNISSTSISVQKQTTLLCYTISEKKNHYQKLTSWIAITRPWHWHMTKALLIFSFHFRCSSAFMPCPTERQLSWIFDWKLSSNNISSQHTANANELFTYTLLSSCRFRICILCGVNHKGAELTGN